MPAEQLPIGERLASLRASHPELRTGTIARATRARLEAYQGSGVPRGPRPERQHTLNETQRAEAKRTFLEVHGSGLSVTAAARAAGVDPRVVYKWKERDPQFEQDCHQAEIQALHVLEDEAFRRAVEGNPYKRTSYWRGEPVGTDEKIEFSDTLMAMLLKARAPDKYRDRLDMQVAQVIKAIGFDPGEVLGRAPHSTQE